jgi:hypothetical protein
MVSKLSNILFYEIINTSYHVLHIGMTIDLSKINSVVYLLGMENIMCVHISLNIRPV